MWWLLYLIFAVVRGIFSFITLKSLPLLITFFFEYFNTYYSDTGDFTFYVLNWILYCLASISFFVMAFLDWFEHLYKTHSEMRDTLQIEGLGIFVFFVSLLSLSRGFLFSLLHRTWFCGLLLFFAFACSFFLPNGKGGSCVFLVEFSVAQT
jgi:hypothetical protein